MRFVVDCGVVLELASEGVDVPPEHELLAPTLLRSQTLSTLHEAVHNGELSAHLARERRKASSRLRPSIPCESDKSNTVDGASGKSPTATGTPTAE
jgi:hypothetical protein